MDREKLRWHKRNKTELASVIFAIDKLYGQLEYVKEEYIVSWKATRQMPSFYHILPLADSVIIPEAEG